MVEFVKSNDVGETWETAEWCDCDCQTPVDPETPNGIILCEKCNNPIRCEICDDYNFARIIHCDYVVCFDHENDAVSNARDRR
jgi:hypothetical protein